MTRFVRKGPLGHDFELVEEDGLVFTARFVDMMECGGIRQQLEAARDMGIREDDVMIAAYPKSGMHWLWEIVSMILNKRSEYDKNAKETAMIDVRSKEKLESLPSPRILNMHFPVRWLPHQLLEKRRPIIHIMRNPKDVSVSYYHHYKSNADAPEVGDFTNFLPLMMGEEGLQIFPSWAKYEREWEEFTRANPDFPILNIFYEDLKKDPVKWISKVARFLQSDISMELIKEIALKTEISVMQPVILDVKENGPKQLVDGVPKMYRKGMIGDWKNLFTVAENEKVDKWLDEKLANTDLKFQYS